MSFIEPMFAAPMPKKQLEIRPGEWLAEEKFDGHRLVMRVSDGQIQAWSRNGIRRVLPAHIEELRHLLPTGVYDGELFVPGERSYGVTEIVNGPSLVYTVFDLIELETTELTRGSQHQERRQLLEDIFSKFSIRGARLSESTPVRSVEHITEMVESVWARDGEGLILKNKFSIYIPGKRPKNTWIKIKDLKSAVLTVIGFEASRGLINNRGKYAMVILRDDEGNETAVKTRNDEELRNFEREAIPFEEFTLGGENHPAIGRKLRIEYQERTPDGNYRHPRWDRWENE